MQRIFKSNILYVILAIFLFGAQNAMADKTHTPDYYDTTVRDHFRHQRWEQGKKILDQGMKLYGSFSVMNELQGWYYYHYKKYTQARYFLFKSLQDDKANQHARELLVNVEEETRNFSSAICYINEILETNPYDRGWWRRKINIFRKMGNQQEADKLLVRLKEIYPNDAQVQKDIDYQTELNLSTQKKRGDIDGQISALRKLVRANPKNAEYFMQLSNLLLQQGKTAEAAEVAGQGARNTHSAALVKKRVGILGEQGKFTEALTYVKEMQRSYKIGGLEPLINDLEEQSVQAAVNNDPYIMYGKIYERKKDAEALNFLLNTSVARGYGDDALYYISEMKKKKGESFDLVYKEYSVQKRMGNTLAANRLLEKLSKMNGGDADIKEEVTTLHLEKANKSLQAGAYEDAIPELIFVSSHTTDPEVKKSCARRLYNCYLQTRDFEKATAQLETIRSTFDEPTYILSKVSILKAQGKKGEAMALLKDSYLKATKAADKESYSEEYEAMVYPMIKDLMEQGLMKQANSLAMEALTVCPNSQNLYHVAINTADVLKKDNDYVALVEEARKRFPENPYFITKEAGVYTKKEEYETAKSIIRPLLDTYIGDSTFVNAYVGNCELAANKYRKEKQYEKALENCNEGLSYREKNRELLYTKGLIFEDIHQYDSAYYYQSKYVPSIMELSEFKGHLSSLAARMYKNSLFFDYSHVVNGPNDKRNGIASATYTRMYEKNTYEFTLGYAGREGVAEKEDYKVTDEPGGRGVQFGLGWTHKYKPNASWTINGSVATKYYPLFGIKLALDFYDVKISKKFILDNLQPHAGVRYVRSYSRTPNDGNLAIEKWEENRSLLINGGLTLGKDIDQFHLEESTDLYFMKSKFYYSINAKGQFFPVEGNPSHAFVFGGFGTAPEQTLIDNSMPGTFDHMNSYVGMGGSYLLTKQITIGLNGTWYTLYDADQNLDTKFTNYFYLNANLTIRF